MIKEEGALAEKDITEKTLEAYGDVFADIVNGLLFDGEQVLAEQSLTDAQTFSMYKEEGRRLHEQERDVSKYWVDQNGERVNVRIALLGIENQTSYDRDMPLRVIGYDGAAYRAELETPDRYPVVTLVLYFGDKPWGKKRTIFDIVKIPEKIRPYVNDYKINLFEIARLPETAIGRFHSDFKVVADYFIRKRNNPDYRPTDPVRFRHVDEMLKLMTVLTKDHRFEALIGDEGGKVSNMCEVLDRVEAKGREKGREEGRAEGREEGRAEGREEGRAEGVELTRMESIKNVMATLKFTAQQAMDVLRIPADEQPKYLGRLES